MSNGDDAMTSAEFAKLMGAYPEPAGNPLPAYGGYMDNSAANFAWVNNNDYFGAESDGDLCDACLKDKPIVAHVEYDGPFLWALCKECYAEHLEMDGKPNVYGAESENLSECCGESMSQRTAPICSACGKVDYYIGLDGGGYGKFTTSECCGKPHERTAVLTCDKCNKIDYYNKSAESFNAFSIDKDDEGKIHIENKCDGCGKEFLFTDNGSEILTTAGGRAGVIVYENLGNGEIYEPTYSPYGDLLCKSCYKEDAEEDDFQRYNRGQGQLTYDAESESNSCDTCQKDKPIVAHVEFDGPFLSALCKECYAEHLEMGGKPNVYGAETSNPKVGM